jgi:hypothetical protein
LDGAEIILRADGPLEHVAWLSEQSFEKTIKYVYAYYKLKIQKENIDTVYDKMKYKSHLNSTELTLNMLREFYVESYQFIMLHLSGNPLIPEQLKILMNDLFKQAKINGAGFFESMFDNAIRKMIPILRKKEDYVTFLKKTNEDGLRQFLNKFDYDQRIEEMTNNVGNDFRKILSPEQISDASFFMSPLLQQKQFRFIMKVIALCRYVLPYTEMSRYPLRECNYENLRLFRELEPQLRPYFILLIGELRKLIKDSDDYIESLVALHGALRK